MGKSVLEELFGQVVDIGKWVSYNSYINQEKVAVQRKNLSGTGLYNSNDLNDIKFIPTKTIEVYNDDIMQIQSEIIVKDTEVVLENEVFYNAKIEGAETTLIRTRELHRGSKINADNRGSELMVFNGFKAVKYLNLMGNRINKDILLNVWNMLVDGCCENECIRGDEYRIGDVYVGKHKGIDCSLINEYMNYFIQFYESDKYDSIPFIKAGLLHYAFETIHPFCDGNGRLGRLLINNYLISRGFDCCKAVSFSKFISNTRKKYDVAFAESENIYNDCTPFMEYMLEVFDESLHSALESQKLF